MGSVAWWRVGPVGPWPYKELRRKGAKGRQKNIKGGAKTALKAAPLQKASEGAPERRPEGARTASRGRQNGVQRAPKRRPVWRQKGVQGCTKWSSKGRQKGLQGAPKERSMERQKGVQGSAKGVFKEVPKWCLRVCKKGCSRGEKKVFKRMPQ